MGKVIVFPSVHENDTQTTEVETEPTLAQKVDHFLHLRNRQQALEQKLFEPSPAKRRMNRLASEMLDMRIDRAVQDLQRLPADHHEAHRTIRTLFAWADEQPTAVTVLEEAALYVVSAYWDSGYIATQEVAHLLRARAYDAQLRHTATGGGGMSPTIDMIHAVVTQHVTGCYTTDRIERLYQIEQCDLLEYFDHPDDDPDFPPVA